MAYGRMMHLGLNPGQLGPQALPLGDPFRALVSRQWRSSPSVYGPTSLAIFWLSTVTGAVWSSLLLYKLLSLLTAWSALIVAYRACEAALPEAELPAALVITLVNPLFLWEVAGQGHNDGVMVVFAFLAVALLYRNRANLSAFSLAVGMLVKSAVAPVLFFLAVRRMPRLRDRYYAAACVLGVALVGIALWVTPSLLLAIDAPLRGADVAKRLSNSVPALLFATASLAGPAAALDTYRIYWTLSNRWGGGVRDLGRTAHRDAAGCRGALAARAAADGDRVLSEPAAVVLRLVAAVREPVSERAPAPAGRVRVGGLPVAVCRPSRAADMAPGGRPLVLPADDHGLGVRNRTDGRAYRGHRPSSGLHFADSGVEACRIQNGSRLHCRPSAVESAAGSLEAVHRLFEYPPDGATGLVAVRQVVVQRGEAVLLTRPPSSRRAP